MPNKNQIKTISYIKCSFGTVVIGAWIHQSCEYVQKIPAKLAGIL